MRESGLNKGEYSCINYDVKLCLHLNKCNRKHIYKIKEHEKGVGVIKIQAFFLIVNYSNFQNMIVNKSSKEIYK